MRKQGAIELGQEAEDKNLFCKLQFFQQVGCLVLNKA
jgi:hypothetical protein